MPEHKSDLPDFFSEERLASREQLREAGIDPYPYSFDTTHTIGQLVGNFEELAEDTERKVRVAGRMTSRRVMGKTAFLDLRGGPDRIQVYLRRDDIGADLFKLVKRKLSLGDILGVEGTLFVTKTGERSIHATSLTVLCATCAEIPYGKSKDGKSWYSLEDIEVKRTQRHLDWLTDAESFERFRKRSEVISWIREYMAREGFLEVDTPTIEPLYGGAEARPFTVEVNALGNQKAFLRIAPELYLKRYIVGGYPKVFTICKNFRNEGIDHSHNPEFTMMEWYEAYTDYERQMERFEELTCLLVERARGKLRIEYRSRQLDFTRPWKRYSIPEAIEKRFGKGYGEITQEEIGGALAETGAIPQEKLDAMVEDMPRGYLAVELVELLLHEELFQPSFLLDFPEETSPLTKARRGRPGFVERFEPFAAGMEIGNAYSELTDPVEQFERFKAQRELPSGGDRDYEDNPMDLDFIHAVACGLPPTGGVGFGVDRVMMILLGCESVRDVIAFPMRRSVVEKEEGQESGRQPSGGAGEATGG